MGFVNVTGDSPTSELVAAVVPTAAARSGLLATSGAPLEPLDPFPNGHWSVVDEEYVADRFKMSFCQIGNIKLFHLTCPSNNI